MGVGHVDRELLQNVRFLGVKVEPHLREPLEGACVCHFVCNEHSRGVSLVYQLSDLRERKEGGRERWREGREGERARGREREGEGGGRRVGRRTRADIHGDNKATQYNTIQQHPRQLLFSKETIAAQVGCTRTVHVYTCTV